MWFRSVVAGLIVSILLLFGCGEDAEETTDDTEDQQTYVTESQIAFVSDRDGYYRIYLMNTDGTNQRPISDPPYGDDTWPAWSPDGKQIAFVNDDAGESEIYVMDADGRHRRNLTNNPTSHDTYPAWSPGGGVIAFSAANVDYRLRNAATYVMDADGGNVRRVSDLSDRITWSPDGTQMMSTGQDDRTGDGYVRVMGLDGRNLQTIDGVSGYYRWAAWSPDGRR
ncbi:MAG: hypothetical protein ABGY41_03745, partial [Candidatus Poribacteria bacterium]